MYSTVAGHPKKQPYSKWTGNPPHTHTHPLPPSTLSQSLPTPKGILGTPTVPPLPMCPNPKPRTLWRPVSAHLQQTVQAYRTKDFTRWENLGAIITPSMRYPGTLFVPRVAYGPVPSPILRRPPFCYKKDEERRSVQGEKGGAGREKGGGRERGGREREKGREKGGAEREKGREKRGGRERERGGQRERKGEREKGRGGDRERGRERTTL